MYILKYNYLNLIVIYTMDRLQRLLGSMGGASMAQPGMDTPTVDSSEVVHISSLALLKVKQ